MTWQNAFITLEDQTRLHYWYQPAADGPKLLFAHGWAEYGMDMDRLSAPFQGKYSLLAPDARAHGESDGPPTVYDLQSRVDDLLAAMDAAGFDRAFLIGHSMGANTSAYLAAQHPERVRGLVLIDPSWGVEYEEKPAEEREKDTMAWERSVQNWHALDERKLQRFADHAFPGWHADDRAAWVRGKQMIKLNTVYGHRHAVKPWHEYIDQVRCPGVIFTGSNALGAHVTPRLVLEVKARWQDARIVNVPEADHYVHHYACDLIQAEITRMLEGA
ncbi:MAG: alpha/beta hydrolase [Anaerolineaceae bacterium]|nr:alpha/beta hydrolase [Anaerolineaceae bacterium]